ncbi:hypothetical protein HYU21_02865 [Candidatus Woesearchaeota archaeon]|nr:hypothetical protein [Candidatus Woesearchaeota archaeon]
MYKGDNKSSVEFCEEEEETIYSRKKREILMDEEGLTNAEDGFMNGYENSLCIMDEDDFLDFEDEEQMV